MDQEQVKEFLRRIRDSGGTLKTGTSVVLRQAHLEQMEDVGYVKLIKPEYGGTFTVTITKRGLNLIEVE